MREMGTEFAAQFPKVAARLALEATEVADPYVERLLEGLSFLAARIREVDTAEMEAAAARPGTVLLDVREPDEYDQGAVPGAIHIPLGYLTDRYSEIAATKPVVVQCQSGGRSAIGASLLERLGVANVINLSGGMIAWAAAGLPVEERTHEQEATRA